MNQAIQLEEEKNYLIAKTNATPSQREQPCTISKKTMNKLCNIYIINNISIAPKSLWIVVISNFGKLLTSSAKFKTKLSSVSLSWQDYGRVLDHLHIFLSWRVTLLCNSCIVPSVNLISYFLTLYTNNKKLSINICRLNFYLPCEVWSGLSVFHA